MTATRPARVPGSSRAPAAAPSPSPSGTTTLDPVMAKLTTLGLEYPAAALPELVEQAAREALSPLAFLDLLLTGQLERNDERRITTMLKLSGLPPGKTLEDFDWGFQPKADDGRSKRSRPVSTCARRPTSCFWGRRGSGRVISARRWASRRSRTASASRTSSWMT